MKRQIITFCCLILSMFSLFFLSACTTTVTKIDLTSISLPASEVFLYESTQNTIKIFPIPGNATNLTLVVSSDDTSVAQASVSAINKNWITVTTSEYDSEDVQANNCNLSIYYEGYESIGKSMRVNVVKTPIDLDVPQNVAYNEQTGYLSWDEISGAAYYDIEIEYIVGNDNFIKSFRTVDAEYEINFKNIGAITSDDDFIPFDKVLSVRVKALGSKYGQIIFANDSEFSDDYQFVQLENVKNIKINDADFIDTLEEENLTANPVLSWDENLSAHEYLVSINGFEITVTENYLNSYAFTDDTTYTIKIKAIGMVGEDYTTYDSGFCEDYVVNKLVAPENALISQNVFTWSAVSNAQNYRILMEKYNTTSSLWEQVLLFNTVGLQTSYILPSDIDAGNYRIKVATNGNNITTLLGNYSAIAYFTKLSAPTNLRVENGIFMWDDNASAVGYKIIINGNEYSIVRVLNETLNSFSFDGTSFAGQQYNIKLVSSGNGINLINSNQSESFVLTKLTKPQISIADEKVVWQKVTYADSYTINFNGTDYLLDVTDDEQIDFSFNPPSDLVSGEYVVKVLANASGNFVSSNWSTSITISKMATPVSMTVVNGNLSWPSVSGATLYSLLIDDEVYTTTNNSYSLQGFIPKNYTVKYFVIGNSTSQIRSNYCAPINVTKLTAPTSLGVVDGAVTFAPVANATNYTLKVNDNIYQLEDFSPSGSSTLNIQVRAEGNSGEGEVYYIDSDYCTEVLSVKLLSQFASGSVYIDGGVLSYTLPQGAEDVQVDVYASGETDIYQTTYMGADGIIDFNDFEVGSYTIEVYAIVPDKSAGDENAYIYPADPVKVELSFNKLAAPTSLEVSSYSLANISTAVNGVMPGVVSWNDVGVAVSYNLQITCNGDSSIINLPANSNQLTRINDKVCYRLGNIYSIGTYSFRLQIVGNGSSNLTSAFSAPTQDVMKLAKPTNFRVEDGAINWDGVTNTNSGGFVAYLVKFNNFYDVTLSTHYEIGSNYVANNYLIQITALPINYGLIGDVYGDFVVTKLTSPTNMSVSNGILGWTQQTLCAGYYLTINDLQIYYDKLTSNYLFPSNINSFDLLTEIANNDSVVNKTGDFAISLSSLGTVDSNIEETFYLNSDYSADKIMTIMLPPDRIRLEYGVVTWDSVVGATQYLMEITNTTTNITEIVSVSRTSYVLDEDYAPGEYSIIIKSIGNGSRYISSEYSNAFVVEKLPLITGIAAYDGKLVFDPNSDASGYEIKICDNNNSQLGIETITLDHIETVLVGAQTKVIYTLGSMYGGGTYNIYVRGIGSTTTYGDTPSTNFATGDYGVTSFVAQKFYPITSLGVVNNNVTWSSSETYNGRYIIYINQSEFYIEQETHNLEGTLTTINDDLVTLLSGVHDVNVKIRGNTTGDSAISYLDSDYLNENTQITKLPHVADLQVINGVVAWTKLANVPTGFRLTILNNDTAVEKSKIVLQSVLEQYNAETGGNLLDYTYYVMQDADFVAGNYTITVRNLAYENDNLNNILQSKLSDSITVRKVNAPVLGGIDESNNIGWTTQILEIPDKILDYEYEVWLTDVGTSITTKTIISSSVESEYDLNGITSGQYIFKVRLKSKCNYNYINSSFSEEKAINMPPMPTGVTISNGKVTWNEISNVTGYKVVIDYIEGTANTISEGDEQSSYTVSVSTPYYYLTELGKYKISVSAYMSDNLTSQYSAVVGDTSSAGVNGYYLYNMFYAGNGSEASPYQILNSRHLKNVRFNPTANYILIADIELMENGIDVAFVPIGSLNDPFIGSFDGNDMTISNLYIVSEGLVGSIDNIGMFGYIGQDGVVKDFIVSKTEINCGYNVGNIAGYNRGLIENVTVYDSYIVSLTKSIDNKINCSGGIVGYNKGTIKNCFNSGVVDASVVCSLIYSQTGIYKAYAGGIAGYNEGFVLSCANGLAIEGSLNDAKVFGTYAGGIVGFNANKTNLASGSINKCYNYADIYSYALELTEIKTSGYAGGIVGYNHFSLTEGTIRSVTMYSVNNCYNTGNIYSYVAHTTFSPYAGGIAGYTLNGIALCYNVGDVGSDYTGLTPALANILGYIADNKDDLNNSNYKVSSCFGLTSSGLPISSNNQHDEDCMNKSDVDIYSTWLAGQLGTDIWIYSAERNLVIFKYQL